MLNEKSHTVDMVGVYLQCPELARGFNIISKILKNAPLQGIVLFVYLSFTKLHQSATYQYFCTFFYKCKTMYIIPCGFFFFVPNDLTSLTLWAPFANYNIEIVLLY